MFHELAAVDFDPKRCPRVFRHVETSLLGALAEAFDCRKQNIDYFYDDGREVQAPGTKTLLVTSDRTNTIPMSEGRGVGGERYLACRHLLCKGEER